MFTPVTSNSSITHFSIFLHNKVGAFLEIIKLLEKNDIIILAFSILDLVESSILRILVSDPQLMLQVLNANSISFSQVRVLVVALNGGAENFSVLMRCLLMAEINIFFTYPLIIHIDNNPVLVIHSDDNECAATILTGNRYKVLSEEDLLR